MNVAEVCSHISSSRKTIEKYLGILCDTYVCSLLPPYVQNKRNEIKYAKKVLFMDNGLRNIAIKEMKAVVKRSDYSALAENAIATELFKRKHILEEIYYWRLKG